jgi:ParB-like chromosome segregation protein Spo0J
MPETDAIIETPGPLPTDDDADTVLIDTRVEALLNSWKLTFDLDPAFPIAKLKFQGSTQIRQEAHRAPTTMVEQFETHLKHGAVFPPILITTNNEVVDGNTRVAAFRRAGHKTIAAYRVKFPQHNLAKMIGAAVNQFGGARLADDEIIAAAEAMISEGYGEDAIARALGKSPTMVRNVRREREYRAAAERLGVDKLLLSRELQRTLAGISHDAPFKAAVELVARAKPSRKDANALVEKIADTRSDADAIALIQKVEESWGPVVGPPPHRKSQSNTKAKKALGLVQQVLAISTDPGDLFLPDHAEAAAAWAALNALSTGVVALAIKV